MERLQKLINKEYKEIKDVVLLESSFAQTTKDGRGLRQVQIGLTPTKLLIASDRLEQEDPKIKVDPEISTLNLHSLLPLNSVNMSIHKKTTRHTMKAHFCNNQTLYFELASRKRETDWNSWCEKMKFLKPDMKLESDSSIESGKSQDSRKSIKIVNRFREGVNENCSIKLYMSACSSKIPKNSKSSKNTNCFPKDTKKKFNFEEITPMGFYINGFGTIQFSKNELISLQTKKWASTPNISETSEPEFNFCIPKRQLISTISTECMFTQNFNRRTGKRYSYLQGKSFGTSQFAFPSYRKLMVHLQTIRSFLQKRPKRTKTLNKFEKILSNENGIKLSSWDFNSSMIAHQMTIIDRELFLNVGKKEIEILLNERNSENAPWFNAMIQFSKQISNLIATEIINVDSIKLRAILIRKYINVADKLHRLNNMQSTNSVLVGLTHPALYRLNDTWSFIRRYHFSKYLRMMELFELYSIKRKMIHIIEGCEKAPYIVSVHFFVDCLLDCLKSRKYDLLVEKLKIWQEAASKYDLPQSPLTNDFLTTSKYYEGYDLWLMSLNLE